METDEEERRPEHLRTSLKIKTETEVGPITIKYEAEEFILPDLITGPVNQFKLVGFYDQTHPSAFS
jgi:hypothetical protein